MSDFVIPKGKDFTFRLNVKDNESFLAQDLTNIDTATFKVFNKELGTCVFELVYPTNILVVSALNGIMSVTIPSANTSNLTVYRGEKEDGYYLKSGYQGYIEITFDDSTTPISVLINDIYVAPTGEACA